jgi:CBS domain-containing protein
MGERLTTGEICTRSVTIAFKGTSLVGAAGLMRENHVGSLVVVEETGGMRIVVGMLTDRDLVTAVLAADVDPRSLNVGDVMVTDLVTRARKTR